MTKPKPKIPNGLAKSPLPVITAEERHRMIAEAAYYRALQRGFSAGSSEDDWLQAEHEVNQALLKPSSRGRKSAKRTAKPAGSAAAEQP